MTVDIAELRQAAGDRQLERRLRTVGFPLSLRDAITTASVRNVALTQWAREAAHDQRVRYSAQLEMLMRGSSLTDIAHSCLGREVESAISLRETLEHLARWPEPEETGERGSNERDG